MNVHEIAKAFPDAAPIIRAKLKEQEEHLRKRDEEYNRIKGRYIKRYGDPEKAEAHAMLMTLLSYPEYVMYKGGNVSLKKLADRNRKILHHIELQKVPRRGRVENFERDLAKARSVPIDSIIDFDNSGKACCVFHNEKTPSMKYYRKDNRVKCFGCDKYADGIEIVQHLYNYDFKQAVDHLAHI